MKPSLQLFINGRFVTQRITGVQRYAREIVRALDGLAAIHAIPPEWRLTLLVPPGATVDGLACIEVRAVGRFSGQLWEQVDVPYHARGGMLLNLCNTAPLFKLNQIVTLHDAGVYAVPLAYRASFRAWYKVLFNVCGRTAHKVLTVSRFSRDELARFVGLSKDRIAVVPEGADHILSVARDPSVFEQHDLGGRRYVLAVSSLSPHKNFGIIPKAIQLLDGADFDLVIAGADNPKIFGAANADAPGNVKHVGYVSDGQLRCLYENAACFIFPSWYEGFGLPPLEAMACGCPVIVSNAASLPEICADAALLFDAGDPKDLATKIEALLTSPALQESLRAKGRAKAAALTWQHAALELWSRVRIVAEREH